MLTQNQIEKIVDVLATVDKNTKIYLGCDSIRIRKNGRWYGKYATVAIIHKNGKSGCQIFSHKSVEPDYDVKQKGKQYRPKIRMMNEVAKVCQLYTQLIPFIDEYQVEIHLDISQDPKNASNCAAKEAAGYVLGVTGMQPKLKPDSFAASFGADHIANKG